MTTAVMGCYQKEAEPIDIPGRTPSGTSAPQPSATPAGEVIPSVDRQAELAEARAKNPDTVAWLYIPGAEAVSYTHLDVYKRQLLVRARQAQGHMGMG